MPSTEVKTSAAATLEAAASLVSSEKPPLFFVIGPIGKDFSPERKHSDLLLHAVIKQILEAQGFDYQVKRADDDAKPGMIGDGVISDIVHADLVVADLTDLNPNAFYELGIRHSTLKPTIHVAKIGTQLPFDNFSHRTIFIDLTDWQSIERGRGALAAAARSVKEPGFQVSNPITQSNASFKMRESADSRDRLIAELLGQQNLEPKVRLVDVTIPAQNPALRLSFPLKCYATLQNESAECVEVRVSEYRPRIVTLKRFVLGVLQVNMHGWYPRPDGVDRIPVLPQQSFRAWIGVDENKFSEVELNELRGQIGTLVFLVNGKPVAIEL
jgi:hypothetical protein